MKKVLVVAPHPDDETLGCGASLLKHKTAGDQVFWLIVTAMKEDYGFTSELIAERQRQIAAVGEIYGFTNTFCLGLPPAGLDAVARTEIVEKIGNIMREISPEVIYLPYPGDVHSDHRVVFEAASACTKSFRYASVKRVLVYETLSETEQAIDPVIPGFRPNVFVDVTGYIEEKNRIMAVYKSEVSSYPFPRSAKAVEALAAVRGATAGCEAAEAFMLVREIS